MAKNDRSHILLARTLTGPVPRIAAREFPDSWGCHCSQCRGGWVGCNRPPLLSFSCALAIDLNVNARSAVLHSHTGVVHAGTEVVSGFHVVKARTSVHAAAFTKAAVTNLATDPIRAGRTRNQERGR